MRRRVTIAKESGLNQEGKAAGEAASVTFLGDGIHGGLKFLDRGKELFVRGFAGRSRRFGPQVL
jgi:hypothetical protein